MKIRPSGHVGTDGKLSKQAGNWLRFAIVDRGCHPSVRRLVDGTRRGGPILKKHCTPDWPIGKTLVFSLLPFPQANPWSASIFVDEFDAPHLECALQAVHS